MPAWSLPTIADNLLITDHGLELDNSDRRFLLILRPSLRPSLRQSRSNLRN
jgi:hypothetical protein